MKTVCAWCNSEIRQGKEDAEHASHGLCRNCAFHLRAEMGMPLREYLDGLDRPVVVVDSDVVVRIANRKACDLFGKKPSAMEGFRGGRVFECAYSYLPEGCGRTVHCSGCAIRRTVTETLQYGHGVTHVPARIRERSEQGERETMLIISTALAGEAVLLRVDEIRAGKTLCAF